VDAPSLSYGRFVANVLAGAGGRIAAIATAFVLSTVLVHALGLAIYGTWAFFFVLIGYTGQFDLGLSVAVERAVARTAADGRPDRIEELLNTGVAMSLALAALLQLLALVPLPDRWLAGIGDPAAVRACLRVLPFCLACSNLAAVAGAGLSGLQRTTTLAAQRSVMGAIAAAAVIALALGGIRQLSVLLVVYALGLLATAVVSWRAVRAMGIEARPAPWRATRAAAGELAVVGGTLQIALLVAQAGDQALRLVLGSAFGAAAIGIYDLASRAAIVPRSLMASLLVALVPFAAARQGVGGRAALSDSLQRSTRYAALAIAAGTIVGLFVAGPFITVWLGGSGAASVDAIRILELLLIALAVQSLTSPMVALARAAGRPGFEALMTAVAQPAALLAAASAGTFVGAVAAYAAVTTAAAIVLWAWLKQALALDGLAARDIAALAVVTVAAAAAAGLVRAAADALALDPWLVLAVVPAGTLPAAAVLAIATGAILLEERRLLLRVVRGRGDRAAAR
jgi:O-antigen/teichoic acid export membrane protein